MERFYIFILKRRIVPRLRNEDYSKILRKFNIQWADRNPSSIYRNFIRVLCLFKVKNSVWRAEYGHILNTKQLDLLGQHDSKYLQHFFFRWTGGVEKTDFEVSGFKLEHVSRTTKEFFPLEMLEDT